MYKININKYQPSHCHNTRLKINNNLVSPFNLINFGNLSTIFKDITILNKYNINLYVLFIFLF